MAASRVDSEVDDGRMTRATAAGSSRSFSREVGRSREDEGDRAEPRGRLTIRDRSKHPGIGNGMTGRDAPNERPKRGLSFSDGRNHVVDGSSEILNIGDSVIGDREADGENPSEPRDKLQIGRRETSRESEVEGEMLDNRIRARGTIDSSERVGVIEVHRAGCDEDERVGATKICAPLSSRAYPRGNAVTAVVVRSSGAENSLLRDETRSFREVVRAAGDHRCPRLSASCDLADRGSKLSDVRGCERVSRSRPWRCSGCCSSGRGDAVDRTVVLGHGPPPVLCRSRSLPRLSGHDSGVACSDHTPAQPGQRATTASQQLVADLRQLLTLRQHYYPEGGWGWVVLVAGLLVQILSHGAHGAVGVFLQQTTLKFGHRVHLQAG